MRRPCALAIALPSLLLAAPAAAYEDQFSVGPEIGYAAIAIPDTDLPSHGVSFGVLGAIGIGDAFELRGRVMYALHPGEIPLHVALFGAELVYQLDVIEIVPFFGLGLDGLSTILDGVFGMELGAHAVVGVDYLLSRDVALGLDIRPHVLPLSIDDLSRVDPIYITVDARISFLFEL